MGDGKRYYPLSARIKISGPEQIVREISREIAMCYRVIDESTTLPNGRDDLNCHKFMVVEKEGGLR